MKNLLIISIAVAMVACGKQAEMISELKKSEEVYLLLLSASETAEQADTIQYVESRAVTKEIKLDKEQREELVSQFMDQNNFEPLNRRCKYEPVYAVKINGKIYATFDVEYCPTVKYEGVSKKEQLLGIKAESNLKAIVNKMLPEK